MTGIFANDTYNNGVTRDNFDKYAHTFDSNARYDNFPPIEDNNDNNRKLPSLGGGGGGGKTPTNKGDKHDKKFVAIIIIAITIMIVAWSINTYYNIQDLKYFQDKKIEAEQRLQQSLSFIIPSVYAQDDGDSGDSGDGDSGDDGGDSEDGGDSGDNDNGDDNSSNNNDDDNNNNNNDDESNGNDNESPRNDDEDDEDTNNNEEQQSETQTRNDDDDEEDKDKDDREKKYCSGKGEWNGKKCVTDNDDDRTAHEDAVCDDGSKSKFCKDRDRDNRDRNHHNDDDDDDDNKKIIKKYYYRDNDDDDDDDDNDYFDYYRYGINERISFCQYLQEIDVLKPGINCMTYALFH